MEEILPSESNNNQDNNQQNLEVQIKVITKKELIKKMWVLILCLGITFCVAIFWYFFEWNAFYKYNVKIKYECYESDFDRLFLFLIGFILLSITMLCINLSSFCRCNPISTIIMIIIMIIIRVILICIYCKILFKILKGSKYLPTISIILECTYDIMVIIFEIMKIIYFRRYSLL